MTGKSPLGAMSAEEIKSLMDVAMGREKADLAVVNASLVNVYTGEIQNGRTVCVKGGRIAWVGDDPDGSIGAGTEVIDAAGKTLIPGLIDGHTHLAWLSCPAEFLKYAMRGGTTTIVTETMEVYPVAGEEGVADFLAALADQPVKIFATAPFMASVSDAVRGISRETLRRLLSRDDVLGLGESYWQALFQDPDRMLPALEETRRFGKTLEGHSAGARGKKLAAYVASGISSCHEPIAAGEALERLRMGIYVMAREGSIRRDLEAISPIRNSGADLRRLILVTDGVAPRDLMEKGYMESVVRKAIHCGFKPVEAIRMATLNVAEHFGLDHMIGGIAPGRFADMVLIPEPGVMEAQVVISNGRIIAREGNLLVQPRPHRFSEKSRSSIRLSRDFGPEDFSIDTAGKGTRAMVRIMEMVTDLVTRELHEEMPVVGGEIPMDPEHDIIKVAAVDRTVEPGKRFVGLLKGFGLKTGAFAASPAWDSSDIVVAGADEGDMARAVNRIRQLQGGAVVCLGGEILAELPLPVFGILSDMPIPAIVQDMDRLVKAVSGLGVSFPDPLLTLITLTGAAIPYLRICEKGLVNLRDGKVLGLFV